MGRMMPGRIRQEGIELYEQGLLKVLDHVEGRVNLIVNGSRFSYSLTDDDLVCDCDLFGQKGYCQHLAAIEYFFKNDTEGKQLAESLKEKEQQQEELGRRTYFGGLFLDDILFQASDGVRYQLAVEGQVLPYDRNFDWTLKISRFPDSRTYIIKDIGAFLKVVRERGNYQFGKHYFEQIALEQFDLASQNLIDFLWRLVPGKIAVSNDILTGFGRHLRLPLANFEEGLDLLRGLSDFTLVHQLQTYTDLQVLPLDATADLFKFEVKVRTKLIEFIIHEMPAKEMLDGSYILFGNHLYHADCKQAHMLTAIRNIAPIESGLRKVQVDFQDQNRLALSLLDFQTIGRIKAPKKFQIHDFKPEFHFSLDEDGNLLLDLSLRFSNRLVQNITDLQTLPFSVHIGHLEHIFTIMDQHGFSGKFRAIKFIEDDGTDLYRFFVHSLPTFEALGTTVLATELQALFIQKKPTLSIDNKGSLLEISFAFDGIEQEEISQALEALWNDATHFTSQSGRLLVFDEETRKISQTLRHLRARFAQKGQISLSPLATYQLADFFATDENVTFSKEFMKMARDLARPEDFPLPALDVAVTLRDYQQVGVRWMSMLKRYGFGGILADEMGLGKTLQAIAFLSGHLQEGEQVLILAPSSLIYNWQDECRRFAPQLDVEVVYGSKEKRAEQIISDHQILVTSYASFRQDVELYQQKTIDYLILDEAQVMKNAQTKIAKLLRQFDVKTCFALSGTPIENHQAELWSIFQIVLPGLLPSQVEYMKLSTAEIARKTKPFVLRRRKEDVLQELPNLTEMALLNELTDEQKAIYLAQLQQMRSRFSGASDKDLADNQIEILTGITRLRQICDTPQLFIEDYKGESGKIASLKELLVRLKEENHRVLIFSQFRQMLTIIEEEIRDLGLTSYMLTGSTPAQQRQDMTQAFNAGSRDAFLISLKAGGVGLNLTGADTVILVDLWWNPAVESQAISRAHRMGQTEKVECYRLITRGSIEEKILELQESKRHLVTNLLDGGIERASMTAGEIREILGIE
ncbi:TPA: SNF2-related protein [Streptococcus suis]